MTQYSFNIFTSGLKYQVGFNTDSKIKILLMSDVFSKGKIIQIQQLFSIKVSIFNHQR